MNIGGFHKLTTLDFPGVLSALVFTRGCNFHCPYCHNAQLIAATALPGDAPAPGQEEILAFLHKRRKVLDGLAISGGEPCLQPDLEDFCREVKALGYAVKLDTNGSLPHVLERLLTASLLDYVAVDVKTSPADYAPLLTDDENAGDNLRETLLLLQSSAVPFEARTTCVAPFVSPEAVTAMTAVVVPTVPWYFQRANRNAGTTDIHALPDTEIRTLLPGTHPLAQIRA